MARGWRINVENVPTLTKFFSGRRMTPPLPLLPKKRYVFREYFFLMFSRKKLVPSVVLVAQVINSVQYPLFLPIKNFPCHCKSKLFIFSPFRSSSSDIDIVEVSSKHLILRQELRRSLFFFRPAAGLPPPPTLCSGSTFRHPLGSWHLPDYNLLGFRIGPADVIGISYPI
ncbi:hypothetical protein GALMADRAFT_889628 [Galerina marginata CBS 339.88]|uniref:Uncharacterized protein n=1 Tax=Galerina marginata (strain CBS 339.88) TaxID=685588 RepID=A0A067SR35_GALM3|nr:hypothetical protein GALMADRAFT_889628 [Galerina marginata CBS 339.88]